jgi:hypothetical protein
MGVVYTIKIKGREEMATIGSDSRNEPKKINLSEAHQKLGHISIAKTKRIGKSLNWNIVDDIKKCELCTVGKAKQENVIKKSNHETAAEAGERIFLDISSVKNREFPEMESTSKPYWRLLVDEKTQLKFSSSHATKKGMVEPMCELFEKRKTEGKTVKQ